ncbi:alpha-ketoglutarate-dependent dioxygenase AlkB family protein [Mangrovimonas cancribranchiae]|uniref:Alpha-ketoglutarate-dependent dioxygenase AlkB n=1 Tax=Mangrovimonas cancribranchiae TaxID=3080055 RepID=A0AAU6NYJ1_9FLAO
MDLFSNEKNTFSLPDAKLIYYPNFLNRAKANIYFKTLLKETLWQQDDITVFGKTYKQPRLTALYAENNKPYSYSNISMHPKKFTKTLLNLKLEVEDICNHNFSSVLLNLYRNGNDSNGWHADNEKELGKHPTIASLSLGTERVFKFKHRTLKNENHKLLLQHGSLLIMKGAMQEFWVHQIPKTKQQVGKRINLTFRYIN